MTATQKFFLDTETAGGLDNPIVYDFGGDMHNGNMTISAIIAETFFDHDLMDTAYYADKRPAYVDAIFEGDRTVENFFAVRKQIHDMVANGQKVRFFAHNAAFDVRALNNTCRYLTNGKVKYFFPYGVEICDTLKMARQVLLKMPTYVRFCEENGYMTKHATPRPRLTAEVIYRFITKDNDFVEEHKGLEDVKIEEQIYDYIMRQHKKCDQVLYPKKG